MPYNHMNHVLFMWTFATLIIWSYSTQVTHVPWNTQQIVHWKHQKCLTLWLVTLPYVLSCCLTLPNTVQWSMWAYGNLIGAQLSVTLLNTVIASLCGLWAQMFFASLTCRRKHSNEVLHTAIVRKVAGYLIISLDSNDRFSCTCLQSLALHSGLVAFCHVNQIHLWSYWNYLLGCC